MCIVAGRVVLTTSSGGTALMTVAAARTATQRKADVLHKLETDVDAWISTAGPGDPYLIPLSFLWYDDSLIISTPSASPTARNLSSSGKVRVGLGATRDVVHITGTAVAMSPVSEAVAEAFAAKAGFDPRKDIDDPYTYFRIQPSRIQAWRESNELPGRTLMRSGTWLV